MTLIEFISKLDRITLIILMKKIIIEFPIIKEQMKNIFKEHINDRGHEVSR